MRASATSKGFITGGTCCRATWQRRLDFRIRRGGEQDVANLPDNLLVTKSRLGFERLPFWIRPEFLPCRLACIIIGEDKQVGEIRHTRAGDCRSKENGRETYPLEDRQLAD